MTREPAIEVVLVICERCHKKQANRLNSGCVRCGHPYGRYVSAEPA